MSGESNLYFVIWGIPPPIPISFMVDFIWHFKYVTNKDM